MVPLLGAGHRLVEGSGLEKAASRELRRDLVDHFVEGLDAGVPVDVLIEQFGEPEIAAELLKTLEAQPPSMLPKEPPRSWDLFDSLGLDVRFAWRVLRKSPTFSMVAAFVLALGIGASTVTFTILNELLLRPLPIPDQESLVDVLSDIPGGNSFIGFSYPDYRDYVERNTVLDVLSASTVLRPRLGDRSSSEQVPALLVSANFFDVLHIPMERGRSDFPEIGGRGSYNVAVVSHGFWQRRLGGDPDVIGTGLLLDGQDVTVIGIAPEGFAGRFIGFPIGLWMPLAAGEQFIPGFDPDDRSQKRLEMLGRLRPGVSVDVADQGLDAVAAQLDAEHPDLNRGHRVEVVPSTGIDHSLRAGVTSFLTILTTLAAMILAIACLNVGSILLVRAMGREREIVVRLALGARASRLVRQLLVEAWLLTGLGAVGAVFIAQALSVGLSDLISSFQAGVGLDLTLDWRVFLFTAVASFAASGLASLAPALHVLKKDPAGTLRARGPADSAGRLRSALVVAQVSLSVVLVVVSGLFVRALVDGLTADPGFDADEIAGFALSFDDTAVSMSEGLVLRRALLSALTDASPEILSATLSTSAPVGVARSPGALRVPGQDPPPNQDVFTVDMKQVGSSYFETVGISVLRGRDFTEEDHWRTAPVVAINEAFANRFWPRQDPIGKMVELEEVTSRVIAVVEDSRYLVQDDTPDPLIYSSMEGRHSVQVQVWYRTMGRPDELRATVQRAVSGVVPHQVIEPRTARDLLWRALLPQRLGVAIIGGMGLLALILATVGLYGLVQYSVTRERRELGIRMALGCAANHILVHVLQKGFVMVGIGTALGVVVSLAVAPLLRAVLIGTTPADPLIYSIVVVCFGLVALVASFVPARRAIRIDPA